MCCVCLCQIHFYPFVGVVAIGRNYEKKRQEILDVAVQAFRELGFEQTSMSEISARIGGSKATLYNYFSSKEELFFEVIFISGEEKYEATHACLDPATENVREALLTFGQRSITQGSSPEIIAALRLAIAEAKSANLGPMFYERGQRHSENILTDFFRALMAQGRLRTADARVAAQHFRALMEAELLMRLLYGVQEVVSETEIREVTQRFVDVFMAAYGSDNQ